MARLDWMVVCDHAFFDWRQRLCLTGVTRRIEIADLPVVLGQVMVVARLADVQPVEELAINVALASPSGLTVASSLWPGVSLQMFQEYIVATFSDLTLIEQGTHVFRVAIKGQPSLSLEIPVVARHHVESPTTH